MGKAAAHLAYAAGGQTRPAGAVLVLLQSASEGSTMRPACDSQSCGCMLIRTRQVCSNLEPQEKCRFVNIPAHKGSITLPGS
jgi:hypothetical protein